jgi:hypothetical protein
MRLAMTAFALWVAALGCAPTVHPGLTNAQGLGGTRIVDARVHDVIANGPDSCGRLEPGPGPLRYRQPPCRHESVPGPRTTLVPANAHADAGGQQWMEHYHFGWPCEARQKASASGEVVAWSPALAGAGVCGSP